MHDVRIDYFLWDRFKITYSHYNLLKNFSSTELKLNHKLVKDLFRIGALKEDGVTTFGQALLSETEAFDPESYNVKKRVKVKYSEEFLEFLSVFPKDDGVEGFFPPFRSLIKEKEKCALLYEALLKEFSHKDIIDSVIYERDARIDQAKIRGQNTLQFMSNTYNYLQGKKFLTYFHLIKKGPYQPKFKNGKANNVSIQI